MQIPPEFLSSLQNAIGKINVLTDASDIWPYGSDNSRQQVPPDLVAYATTSEQIQSIVNLCNQFDVPVITRGRGTGTTGATVPITGGLVLSLERMNKITRVDPDNRLLVAEPGVTNAEIQKAAGEYGFFWPPDPTSAEFCTLGGNLAYNSAGPRAVKYGTPRENTLGLEAITGQGDKIRTGVYTTKGVVGYDLTRLIIGSEGTLAIITEATLKLTPKAEAIYMLQASYRDLGSAARAIADIMAQAIIPRSLEFMDRQAIDMIREYSDTELPEAAAMLMIEVDGSETELAHASSKIEMVASNEGLVNIHTATCEKEKQSLWKTRKALSPALRKIAPKKINEDVVVPVSNIPDLLQGLEALSQQHGITIVNFGHAGNGNIHVNLLVDPNDSEQMQKAQLCLSQVFDLVLSLDGTLSGEHGVGLEKKDYIDREIDPATLALMRNIKKQFDPKGILNPGKMLPEAKD